MSELQETAFRLYTSGESYESVRKELGITKKRVIDLVRAQGEKLLEMADRVKEPENELETRKLPEGETEVIHPLPMVAPQPQYIQPHPMAPHQPNPPLPMVMPQPPPGYADQEFQLELTAIPKKITLTAYHIGIFDVFVNGGYTGTLSEFAQDAFVYMFNGTAPQGRAR